MAPVVGETLIATNPDPDSRLPYLLRIPLAGGMVFRTAGTWPRTNALYCYPLDVGYWPDVPEIVERAPVRSCVRRSSWSWSGVGRTAPSWWMANITVPIFLVLVGWPIISELTKHNFGELVTSAPPGPHISLVAGTTLVAGGFIVGAVITPDMTRFNRTWATSSSRRCWGSRWAST